MSFATRHRTATFKPGLAWFCLLAMVWATFLLYAGAYTTSIQAGMAFLDWPLSNSSINPDGWLSDPEMRAEHSHRLLGTKLGLLAIGLVIWTQLREARKPVRLLAWALLILIISQGVLGGLRVLLDQLNIGTDHNLIAQTFAVLHACGAQIVICTLATLAIVCSKRWIETAPQPHSPEIVNIRRVGYLAFGIVFIQILIGAVMRHSGAGLAIATFPLASEGSVLPAQWNYYTTVHWLHRLGAVIASVALIWLAIRIFRNVTARSTLRLPTLAMLLLLLIQVLLGAATIWTYKNPVMASTHMLVGAILLAVVWLLTFSTYRLPGTQSPSSQPIASLSESAELST